MQRIQAGIASALLFSSFFTVNGISGTSAAPAVADSVLAAGAGIGNEIKDRIALVEPTFTHAAYQNGSFYNFYQKYSKVTPRGLNVTTDLYLLADRGVPEGPFIHYKAPEKGLTVPHSVFQGMVEEHIKGFAPEANVTKIGDQQVHKGLIFGPDNNNAYSVLVLFHNEYLSQREYDNLRRFVENGGTVLFTMANILYAEVSYNEAANTITLVKGHDWEFDGKAARKSVAERWLNETKQWVGSNFMKISTTANVQFRNNIFNYTHTEEQHVTNTNSRLLLDYGAHMPDNAAFNATVATYELEYGKGKVVMIGLFTNTLVANQSFWEFFDNIILPHSILLPHKQITVFQAAADVPDPRVYWKMKTGNVTEIIVDPRLRSIHVSLDRTSETDDVLLVVLPRSLISGSSGIEVEVNDVITRHIMTECDLDLALKIPLLGKADQIKILYHNLIAS